MKIRIVKIFEKSRRIYSKSNAKVSVRARAFMNRSQNEPRLLVCGRFCGRVNFYETELEDQRRIRRNGSHLLVAIG